MRSHSESRDPVVRGPLSGHPPWPPCSTGEHRTGASLPRKLTARTDNALAPALAPQRTCQNRARSCGKSRGTRGSAGGTPQTPTSLRCSSASCPPLKHPSFPSWGLRHSRHAAAVGGGLHWSTAVAAWLRPAGVQRGIHVRVRASHPPSWLAVVGRGSDGAHRRCWPSAGHAKAGRFLGRPRSLDGSHDDHQARELTAPETQLTKIPGKPQGKKTRMAVPLSPSQPFGVPSSLRQ